MNTLEWPSQDSASGLIDGPEGALEVDIELPKGQPRGFVVVAHPHPQQGGTKDNKVVYMSARGIREAGFATLRFNCRATGRSEGSYDGGRGEQDDLRAVRDWAARASDLPSGGLAGFSFGAAIALRVAADDGTPRLVTIGLPAAYFDAPLPRPDCEWLALFSDNDEIIDAEAAAAAVRELEPAVEIQIMEDAGHFLHGRLSDLRKRVHAFWSNASA